jgi:hypothetical protein
MCPKSYHNTEKHKHEADPLLTVLAELEKSGGFEFFITMCGQYETCTDDCRTKIRKVIEALIEFFDYDDVRAGAHWQRHQLLKLGRLMSVGIFKYQYGKGAMVQINGGPKFRIYNDKLLERVACICVATIQKAQYELPFK